MNNGGRLRSIGRLLSWQIVSRLFAGPIALRFIENTKLFAKSGMAGATGNWYCGLHEAEEMGFVLHFLRQEDLFLDVGANVGSYTLAGAGAVGARVISVEPIPATFSFLRMNVLLNGLEERVQLHCCGLSNVRSELRFTADQDTVNHVMTEAESGSFAVVPVVRMDELLAGVVPKIIKVDVEGHEKAVLMGASNTLSDPGLAAVIMETNGSGSRYGVSDNELLDLMRSYGFMPYRYDPFGRRLVAWCAEAGNAVFVRDLLAVNAIVKEARRYCLVNGTI